MKNRDWWRIHTYSVVGGPPNAQAHLRAIQHNASAASFRNRPSGAALVRRLGRAARPMAPAIDHGHDRTTHDANRLRETSDPQIARPDNNNLGVRFRDERQLLR